MLFIVSSFWAKHEKEINCHYCLNRDKPDKVIESDRIRKGCYKPKAKPIFENSGINFYSCLGNYVSPDFDYIWYTYKVFKNGGVDVWGLPSKLVEIYQIIDNLVTEKECDDLERAKKKHGQQNRK